MAKYPSSTVVEIRGIEDSSHDCSCEEHAVCGAVLQHDMVLRLRSIQIVVNGMEESAIAAIWVTNGVDRCRVGFLPRNCVKHRSTFDGMLCQVTEILSGESSDPEERAEVRRHKGVCYADIISLVTDEEEKIMKRARDGDPASDRAEKSQKLN